MAEGDNDTCLELALEGEKLCKAGKCRDGVAFFEAALQVIKSLHKIMFFDAVWGGAFEGILGSHRVHIMNHWSTTDHFTKMIHIFIHTYIYCMFTCLWTVQRM